MSDRTAANRPRPRTTGQVLGPIRLGASTVLLRPARLADYRQWRERRIANREQIEPYWYTSDLAWEQRHTAAAWVREYLIMRAETRAGHRVARVIEVDGALAGQIEFCRIDTRSGTAEMSIWIDAAVARRGVATMSGALMVDFGFGELGLHRLVAPVSVTNYPFTRGLPVIGFRPEATMRLYFDAGGAPSDHMLWALTRDELPPAGMAARISAARAADGEPAPAPRIPAVCDAGPSPVTVAAVASRLAIWVTLEQIRRRTSTSTVRITLSGHPNAVLRTRIAADHTAWRTARLHNRDRIDVDAAPGAWLRRHSAAAWRRELRCGRAGLRSTVGLVLVLEVDGRYAGEFRLYDLEMFDHNVELSTWADPGLTTPALRTAALRTVLDFAFGTLGLHRVATEIPTADTESAAITAAAGFLEEGVMRDIYGPTGLRADHALWAAIRPDGAR